jgi:glycosyltransferase involved in cell wall biosynthesis
VFIDETAALGGAEINLIRITARLVQRSDFDVLVILPENGPLIEKLMAQNINVKIVPGCPHFSTSFFLRNWVKLPNPFAFIANVLFGFQWTFKLSHEIYPNTSTVVYTNSLLSHIFGGFAGRLQKCRVCWHFQDIVDQEKRFGVYRRILEVIAKYVPDVIICISQQVANQFGNDKVIISKIRILLNQIDVTKLVSSTPPRKIDSSKDGLCIGTVARLTPWKGQADAIKIAEILSNSGIRFKWLFAGDASLGDEKYREYLQTCVRKSHLEDKVFFLGWVDEIEGFYRSIDLLVHIPTEVEPFGLTIIEAMSNGVPVIATSGGAADAYVLQGGGWIVKSRDHGEVASIIQHITQNPEEFLDRSEKAQDIIKVNIRFDRYVTSLISVINSI